jgi:hypothetical protein
MKERRHSLAELRAIHAKAKQLIDSKKALAYDILAKEKVIIQNPKIVELKNGRIAIEGKSPKSEIKKVIRIVG